MLAQLCRQKAEVHSGAAQPAVQGFIAGLLLGGELHQIQERPVREQNPSVQTGDDEAFGSAGNDLQHLRILSRRHRAMLARQQRQSDQEKGRPLLAEQRCRRAKFAGSICRVDHHVAGSSGRTHGAQQALQGLGAGLVEAVREQAPDQPARALAEQLSGCRVGLENLAVAGVHDQHGLGCHLEQQSMTRLGLAQLEVLALHRLLCAHQLLLQIRHGLHAAAEGDHLTAAVHFHRCNITGRSAPPGIVWLTIRQRGRPTLLESRSNASTLGRLSAVTVSCQALPSH